MNYLAVGKDVAPADPHNSMEKNLGARVAASADVALKYADDVDVKARFPVEAMAAIRDGQLLGLMVPQSLGGEGATVSEIAEICYALGRGCASTGMIFAMHQTKVACIVNHGMGSPWQEAVLRRLCAEQLLFASSTTEGMGGGNVRSSASAIETDGEHITLLRDASVISYGAEADGVVTTARRSPDAAASDQVLAVFLKKDYQLTATGGWDALGMRGTCSGGFSLKARGVPQQILPVPYNAIHSRTMTPVAHLLWSSVWAGIAAAGVQKAELFVRRAMRGSGGQMPPGGMHLTAAKSSLRLLRNLIAASLARYEAAHLDEAQSAALDYQSEITLTKVQASELALQTVMSCYRTCGLGGYRNDGDVSIGRHLRDVLSSPIMINNDRILGNMANMMAMSGVPDSIAG
ncbi:MAG: acyl-CoA/acyl-ACP dehydrogenase [Rhizobiales bacterium]|nr:acyl-CoA/acyl-ACP dehydrogenase [Hyphomicrobiales bacterium]MBI3673050.1 acyl-CoA/acyl-ACP dehydrogenase [Hyphomicrobiales bacterium]